VDGVAENGEQERMGASEFEPGAQEQVNDASDNESSEEAPSDEPIFLEGSADQVASDSALVTEEEDARRVMEVLPRRFERFGLTLHPDKTRLLFFGRPPSDQEKGRGSATFDFLGFTHYWRRTRGGRWAPAVKTRTARLRRAITVVADYCRRHRHRPVKEQHASLKRRLVGHFNYFGVNGNIRSLMLLVREAERSWRKWLRRRSQRTRLTWAHFKATILRVFPLPAPRICVQIWASP
jgi:hypothetical protein